MATKAPAEVRGATRVLLIALAAAAGIIHLAMVPAHWAESPVEGLGFAVVGWAQLALAVALFVRPAPTVLRVGMIATYGFIAVWVVSRVWGLPFGDHAWHPHDPSFVGLAFVGLEIAFVALAGVVLCRPSLGQDRSRTRSATTAVASVAVLVLTTAALASPSARNHADASHADHDHSEASDEVAAGTTGHQHVSTADVKSGWTALGENGHQHGSGVAELDDATQAQLSVQLAPTAQLIAKYPTLADAEAAGYRRAGRFNPGLGVHYGAFGRVGDGAITGVNGEVMVPQLIYDGTEPGSPLAGFMYMADAPEGAVPEGFAGANDHWHYHSKLCIKMGSEGIKVLLPGDENVTAAECAAAQGLYVGQSGYTR